MLPTLAIGASFAAARLLGFVHFHRLGELASNAPVDLIVMTVVVLGEEIGWRGFLLSRMQVMMPNRSAVIVTGVLHGMSHLPLILLTASYDADGSRAIVAPCAVAVIALGGIIVGWLRVRSGSLWPVLLAHSAVNVCLISAPYVMSDNLDRAADVTGEGGALTVLTVGIVAWAFYARATWTSKARRDVQTWISPGTTSPSRMPLTVVTKT
ncbi:MAG: hypothetical protein JWN62_2008 [Acidimicrobiales bacterium]|nr:hypothetical protein [Acidimicrobiales bacterium]